MVDISAFTFNQHRFLSSLPSCIQIHVVTRFWVEHLPTVADIDAEAICARNGMCNRLVVYEVSVLRPTSASEAAFVRATGAESVVQAIAVHSTNPDHYRTILPGGYEP